MKTSIVQMQTNNIAVDTRKGLILVELVVAVVIIGILVTVSMLNMAGLVGRSKFQVKSQELINILRLAAQGAAKTKTRYEIVFDFAEQTYALREMITDSPEDESELPNETIETGRFSDDFVLSYIQFDDFEATDEYAAIFRVGKSGFQYGGKIVILNGQGEPYSIVINRIGSMISLENGDVDILIPKDKDDMPF